MANSATLTASINAKGKTLYQYTVVIDTTGTDLTIRTPATNNQIFLHSIAGVESGAAATLTFKSGSTTLFVPEFQSGSGTWERCSRNQFMLATAVDGALKIQSTAAYSSLLLIVSEDSIF